MDDTPRSRRLLPLLFLFAGCGSAPTTEMAGMPAAADAAQPGTVVADDIHSFALPEVARVVHTQLDLTADFDARRLTGTATATVVRAPGAQEVVLDTRDLDIERVTDTAGHVLRWELGEEVEHLGRPLRIALPADGGDTVHVVVDYRTHPDAAAVQWLEPRQTAGGKKPYLFTQGEAILTRTWIPTQDSPGVRQTYGARIVVPEDLTAVMSAESLTPGGEAAPGGCAFRFEMTRPIPAYLIALAIGDLAFREIGPRTGVWSEPGVVDAAAAEFADMEKMLTAAERLYGPYRWGRYDVLVLPPSFPFGGMENPRLTFATPTVLAGDRSLVSLVAHEMAHSWSGNLVTNATWPDFWLNEGFTVYFERRILEELYGEDRASMERALGRQSLRTTIASMGEHDPDTRLHLDLAGRDPDDGMTDIAYEKGAAFLETIESVVGRARFDRFLRGYFDRHAFEPMTSTGFLEDLLANLLTDPAEVAAVRPEPWVFGYGLPDNVPPVRTDVFARADAAARAFLGGAAPTDLDTDGWNTQEWMHFLRALPDPLSNERMAALDEAFGFSQSGNSEVRFAWLQHAIGSHYDAAFPALERFLTEQGRRKFIAPLFEALMKTDWGKAMARELYRKTRPLYHSVTRGTVDEIVQWDGGSAR